MYTEEVWKDIEGYEDRYQISNFGNVRSICGVSIIRKTSIDNKGYVAVTIKKQGQSHRYRIHRLVAKAFIPNPDNKPQVNHINGIKTDNRVGNLEWCTDSENKKHAYANGLNHNNIKYNKILCLETGEVFCGICEAAQKTGVAAGNLWATINKKQNKTRGKHFVLIK